MFALFSSRLVSKLRTSPISLCRPGCLPPAHPRLSCYPGLVYLFRNRRSTGIRDVATAIRIAKHMYVYEPISIQNRRICVDIRSTRGRLLPRGTGPLISISFRRTDYRTLRLTKTHANVADAALSKNLRSLEKPTKIKKNLPTITQTLSKLCFNTDRKYG